MSYCEHCGHTRGMHYDTEPTKCGYPECGCKKFE